MSRWALIPVKAFSRGKSRLSEVLEPTERAQLTRELFEHVVGVLQECPSIDGIAVVSESAEARARATELGAIALEESGSATGLADIVDTALDELERRGASSSLVCMSDLPELTVDDIESVSAQLEDCDIVLVPDLLQRGTNVVAMTPARAMPSCLGDADSLRRHRERARDLGLTVSVQLRNGISFDVDSPGDLARLRRR